MFFLRPDAYRSKGKSKEVWHCGTQMPRLISRTSTTSSTVRSPKTPSATPRSRKGILGVLVRRRADDDVRAEVERIVANERDDDDWEVPEKFLADLEDDDGAREATARGRHVREDLSPLVDRRLVLAAVCLGSFTIMVDTTVMHLAAPSIGRAIKASFDQMMWVIDSYPLAITILLIPGDASATSSARDECTSRGWRSSRSHPR